LHRTISGTARRKHGPRHDSSRSSPLRAAEPALKEVGSCRRWWGDRLGGARKPRALGENAGGS